MTIILGHLLPNLTPLGHVGLGRNRPIRPAVSTETAPFAPGTGSRYHGNSCQLLAGWLSREKNGRYLQFRSFRKMYAPRNAAIDIARDAVIKKSVQSNAGCGRESTAARFKRMERTISMISMISINIVSPSGVVSAQAFPWKRHPLALSVSLPTQTSLYQVTV